MPTSGWAEGWRRQRGDASDQANGREEDVQATQGTSAGGRRRKRRGRRWPMPGAARAQLADGGRTVKVATGASSLPSSFTLHARSRWGRENRMGASVMGWREER
ncbi:hypothetical protein EE612_035465 [Oryza sativa]|nr:hypothetical protein EE612_035465 [Oryza sativa]